MVEHEPDRTLLPLLRDPFRPVHYLPSKLERKRHRAGRFTRLATIEDLNTMLSTFQEWYNTARPHRSTGRRTPQEAYTALPKATPTAHHHSEWRTLTDRVDKRGAISISYAGKLRHLGVGRAHAGTPVLILIRDRDVSISNANTSEIIAEHTIDPTRDYQPRQR